MANPNVKLNTLKSMKNLDKKVFDRAEKPLNELLDKPLMKVEFYSGMDTLSDEIVS